MKNALFVCVCVECEIERKRDKVHVFNEGLLVLLLFNNNEHCLEQFVCLFIFPLLWAGKKKNTLDSPLAAPSSRIRTLESTAAVWIGSYNGLGEYRY